MLRKFFSLLLLQFFIALALYTNSAQTKTPRSTQPQTVVDYYMLLPDKYFEASREQRHDNAADRLFDVANGGLCGQIPVSQGL